MERRFHIIITSEQGQARSFVIAKGLLKKGLALLGASCLLGGIVAAAFLLGGQSPSPGSLRLSRGVAGDPTPAVDAASPGPQLTNAYSELTRRSRAIESILSTLEIQTPPAASGKDSGGPFISLDRSTYQELILKVDRDLDTIRPLPLGYPVRATGVTSTFGARPDPLNGDAAFHEGIDLRGTPGAAIKATADGQVVEQGYNDDYGWYVRVKHSRDYTTLYAHNQKLMTNQGDRVARGQTIARLGNTGRSTGPHLHYEIRRHDRPINPARYLNIGRLLADHVG